MKQACWAYCLSQSGLSIRLSSALTCLSAHTRCVEGDLTSPYISLLPLGTSEKGTNCVPGQTVRDAASLAHFFLSSSVTMRIILSKMQIKFFAVNCAFKSMEFTVTSLPSWTDSYQSQVKFGSSPRLVSSCPMAHLLPSHTSWPPHISLRAWGWQWYSAVLSVVPVL